MKLNTEWHMTNPMPKNPTIEQGIKWHVQHMKHCHCREDIPQKLKEEMKKLKIRMPEL